MLAGRSFALALSLFVALPAAAQTAPADGGQSGGELVVTGSTERMSDWRRADSDHVTVFSDGSEAELKRVTNNVERLFQLMSRLFRKGDVSDDTERLQIVLLKSSNRLRLPNLRSEEGPYQKLFAGQRYYDPREDGAVLAVARDDQIIELNTGRRYDSDCGEYVADGGAGACAASVPYHPPLVRPWEALVYSAFAQHFLLTHAPMAYPRWYLDGIGALFSTIAVRRDGALDYAVAPLGYDEILKSYGRLFVGDVLSGQYLGPQRRMANWTPYHAGLLAHFFLYSDRGAKWHAPFVRYMTAVQRGVPLAEAAAAFGDMRKLQRDFASYVARPTAYARAKPLERPLEDPVIVRLTASSATLIEARLGLDAGPDRFARLRAEIARAPYSKDAMLLLAEMECRAGHAQACLDIADGVLARAPDDIRALAWKGTALTDQAVAGDAAARAAALAAARAALERAIALDGRASLPRIAYFQSFVKAGERVPDKAMAGMARVIQNVPAAPGPRLYLGEELVRQGQPVLARKVLNPVLYGGYDSPERMAAERLFAARP